MYEYDYITTHGGLTLKPENPSPRPELSTTRPELRQAEIRWEI